MTYSAGRGGATKGLLAAGWDVIGVDIEDMGDYPPEAHLHLQDIRTVTAETIRQIDRRPIGFIWASPPCQEFSYRSFPFKKCVYLRDNVPPDKTLWEAALRIADELKASIVIENVRGAERYMGKAKYHYGPWYLWGNVPWFMPKAASAKMGGPTKGFHSSGPRTRKNTCGLRKSLKDVFAAGKHGLNARKEWSAKAAMIPLELSTWIGKCFLPEKKVTHEA